MEQRIKLTVAYLGGRFCGWQRQPEGPTVQHELERSLDAIASGHRVTVVGAGRTDAGVHAAAQVAHADLPVTIPAEGLMKIFDGHLPEDIRVRSAITVDSEFHARRSALGKHYVYRARWRSPSLPWTDLRTATVRQVADRKLIARALELLPGYRDMASFSVPQTIPTTRTIFRAWAEERRHGVDFHFVGDGFLRYQVRRMAGALLDIGRRRISLEDFETLLEQPRPGASLFTAPARGLTLERVFYRHSTLLESQ